MLVYLYLVDCEFCLLMGRVDYIDYWLLMGRVHCIDYWLLMGLVDYIDQVTTTLSSHWSILTKTIYQTECWRRLASIVLCLISYQRLWDAYPVPPSLCAYGWVDLMLLVIIGWCFSVNLKWYDGYRDDK